MSNRFNFEAMPLCPHGVPREEPCEQCTADNEAYDRRIESEEAIEMSNQVGFLMDGRRVLCFDCHNRQPDAGVPIYHVNIYPYKGSCNVCGKILVEPRSANWPELFDGPPRVETDAMRYHTEAITKVVINQKPCLICNEQVFSNNGVIYNASNKQRHTCFDGRGFAGRKKGD